MNKENDKGLFDKINNLKLIFLGIERELEKIPAETESEFLSLSSLLRNSYERTWIIADLFSSSSVLMSGHEMSEVIEEIRGILEKLENHAKESESKSQERIESFNQVLNTIENVKKELAKFRKISKDLRVLSTVANVYDASVTKNAQGDSDFSVLVKDITKLSNVLLSKSAAVKAGMNGIEKKISYAVSRMMSFKERQYTEMGSVVLYIKATFDALTKKYTSATGKFSDTSEWSQSISKNIEKVVLSIQYHDITVQKFERSRKAFSDIGEKIDAISGKQSARETIAELANFCEGQLSDICKSRDELSAAVASIVTSMNEISRNAIALSETTHTMSASANMAGRSFFAEMKGSLDSVKSALSELNETNLEVSKAVGSVNSVVGDITMLVNEIDSIGKSANAIAMNAVRKASHLGKSGMAVGFFAKSIQKLWSESQSLTTSIQQALESITFVADSLSDSIKQDIDSSPDETQPMEQEMTSLITSLSGLNNELTSQLAYMEEEVQTLSEEIDMVADRSNFLDNVVGIIDGVVSVLGDMGKNLVKAAIPDSIGVGSGDNGGKEQKGYLLQLLVGSGKDETDENIGSNIEFFDSRYSIEKENADA